MGAIHQPSVKVLSASSTAGTHGGLENKKKSWAIGARHREFLEADKSKPATSSGQSIGELLCICIRIDRQIVVSDSIIPSYSFIECSFFRDDSSAICEYGAAIIRA